jgi:hypothetical protein
MTCTHGPPLISLFMSIVSGKSMITLYLQSKTKINKTNQFQIELIKWKSDH